VNKPTKTDWAYLAGLIDGDGCFAISITRSRDSKGEPKNRIIISPRITIAVKASDRHHLIDLQKRFDVGKMYWHKILTPHAMGSWHIIRLADCIFITENTVPFLVIKREKAFNFLYVIKYWQSLRVPTPAKMKGYSHTQSQMLHIIEVACNLNYDRQTVRYRDKKGLDYWKPLVEAWYPA